MGKADLGSCLHHRRLKGSEVTISQRSCCGPRANIKALFVPLCLLSAEFVMFALLAASGMCLKENFSCSVS